MDLSSCNEQVSMTILILSRSFYSLSSVTKLDSQTDNFIGVILEFVLETSIPNLHLHHHHQLVGLPPVRNHNVSLNLTNSIVYTV